MFLRKAIDWAKARRHVLQTASQINYAAANYCADRMRLYCPVDTGAMKSSIHVVASLGYGGGLRNRVSVPVDYSQPVNFGHVTRSGSWVPPQPFATMAVADTARAYPQIARDAAIQTSHHDAALGVGNARVGEAPAVHNPGLASGLEVTF